MHFRSKKKHFAILKRINMCFLSNVESDISGDKLTELETLVGHEKGQETSAELEIG